MLGPEEVKRKLWNTLRNVTVHKAEKNNKCSELFFSEGGSRPNWDISRKHPRQIWIQYETPKKKTAR